MAERWFNGAYIWRCCRKFLTAENVGDLYGSRGYITEAVLVEVYGISKLDQLILIALECVVHRPWKRGVEVQRSEHPSILDHLDKV